MAHYVPIFEEIVDSSIWSESDLVVKVFLTMLAKKKRDGVVYGTAFNIASWAKKTESEVLDALAILSAPDTKRLEPQPFEGRRIEKVEGGWLLLNAAKYQKRMMELNRLNSHAQAQSRYRMREDKPTSSTRNNGKKTPDSSGVASEYLPAASELDAQTKLTALRDGLCGLFDRNPSDPWSYAEESALVDVLKRGACLDELAELRNFQRSNGQYFPQSIHSLLEGWTRALDRARSFEREPANKPPQTIADKEFNALMKEIEKG